MKRFAMKRITALALALIMTLSLCPVTALAAMDGTGKHVCDDPDGYCLVCDVADESVVSALAYNGRSNYYSFCVDHNDNTHTGGTWEAITSEDDLLDMQDGSSYFLAEDITVSNTVTISGTVNLCLNGKTLALAEDAYGSVISVTNGAMLTLCDCSNPSTGKITGGNAVDGGGVCVNSGSFTMNGGNISGNNASVYGSGGGVYAAMGTFTMNGGSISGNTGGYGGGVYSSGTFTMTGGTISGNTASHGGGVVVDSASTITGGSITGNNAEIGGGVYVSTYKNAAMQISGSPNISGNKKGTGDSEIDNNIYLSNGKNIIVDGALTNTTKIGVTMGGSAGIFAKPDNTNVTTLSNYAEKFTSDNAAYEVVVDGKGNLMLTAATTYTVSFNENGGTGEMANVTGVSGEYTLPTCTFTAPTGKQFKGWARTSTGPVITGTTITVNANTTLYAIWEDIPAVAPTVTTSEDLTLTYNSYSDKQVSVSVTAQTGYTYTYQWYDKNDQPISGATNATYTVPNNLVVGDYSYYCVVTAKRSDNNLEESTTSATITVKVNKATPTVTVPTAKTLTYTGEAQELVNGGSANGGTMQYSLSETGNFSPDIPTGTNADIYTVYYKVIGDANYKDTGVLGPVSVTIAKKEIGITWGSTTLTYSGSAQAPTATVARAESTDIIELTVSGAQTNVGTYTATVSGITGEKAGNYKLPANVTTTFTISAKALTNPTLTLDVSSFTYDGTAKKPTVTVKDGDTVLTEGTDYTVSYSENVGAGDGKVTVTFKGNYSDRAEATFTINKANASCTAPTAVSNLTYTGNAQNLVLAATATGGTVQYGLSATGTFSDSVPTGTNAGNYNVYYKVVGDANHNDTAVLGPVQVTVAKAAQAAPTNVGKTDETGSNKNDGTITGVDSTMEYRKDGEDTYKAVVDSKVENLSDGKYFVRYKETENYKASPEVKVTIAAGETTHGGGYPGWYYPIVTPDKTPEAEPVEKPEAAPEAKPEVKPEVTPTTPPAEGIATPEPEDITPEVVPNPPEDDDTVDETPGGDVPEEDESSAGVWIGIGLLALVIIILMLIIMIVHKRRRDERK